MSTGDRRVNIYLKKFLSQQQMVDNFQLLVQKFTEDLYSRIFPESGVFRGGIFASTAVDTIDISTPLEGTQSEGKDIVFDPLLGTQVPFENELAAEYYVGIQFTLLPADIEVNVRTGKLKYVFDEEAIGERADPNLVVDDADGTMTIRVNSVTEAGVDHSGRTIRIFLKATEDGGGVGPQTLITPFEDLIVQYDGSNNYIETTTGLGQSATSISTSPNDYEAVLIGPSIKRNTDLRLIPEVIFLGIVTGSGAGTSPTVFDQNDRRVLGGGGTGGGGVTPQLFAVLETTGTIKHSASTVGQMTWSDSLFYRPFGSMDETQVPASNLTLADDEVAFLQIPDPYVGGADILQIAPRSSLGLQSPDRYWIFHRSGNLVKVRGGMSLEQGEERQLDDVVIGGVLNFGADDSLRFDDTTNIFHFDADGGTNNADLAIGSTVNYGDPTNNDKIAYAAGLLSVLLGNVVTGTAVSAGRFVSQRALATDTAFEALVTADAVSRFLVQADGKIEWSDGALAADTDLFRSGVGILETTNILRSALGTFRANDIDITRDSATLLAIASNLRVANASIYMGVEANNDFLRFVEGATPIWEFLTNNVQRWRVDENGDAVASRDQLSQAGTVYSKPSDASAVTGVNASLNEVSDRTKARDLLKITANNAADKAINIASGRLSLASTEQVGLINSDSKVVTYAGSTVDFGTGVSSVGDNFTAFTPTAAVRFFKYGLLLNAADEIVVVEPAGDGASAATAPEPFLEGGIPVGVVTVESISTTPGDIQPIVEGAILFFGAAGSGGGAGGDTSFTLKSLTGSTATIGKGALRVADGRTLVTGGGTDSETVEVEFSIDLTTINASPADNTTYYLYVDLFTLPAPINLTDNGRKVIQVSQATEFKLLTEASDEVNEFRYFQVGYVHTANAGNAYTGTGAFFGSAPRRTHDLFLDFFSSPGRETFEITSAAALVTLTHQLGGEPQLLKFYYQDGSGEKNGVDDSNVLLDKTSTEIKINSLAFTFGGGQKLILEAFRFREVGEISVATRTFKSQFFTDSATTVLPHGFDDRNDILTYITQEFDTTSGKVRNFGTADGAVQEFDDTNLTLDWSGFTPSATLQYRIIASAAPLAVSLPVFIGGFTKFIGFGPGSYPTITDWLADPNSGAGDSLLITRSYEITAEEDVTFDDVKITFMPGVRIVVKGGSRGLVLSGDRIHVIRPQMIADLAGTLDSLFEIDGGSDCVVEAGFTEANNAGLTLTDSYRVETGDRNQIHGSFKDTASTAVTNPNGTDNGTTSDLTVMA